MAFPHRPVLPFAFLALAACWFGRRRPMGRGRKWLRPTDLETGGMRGVLRDELDVAAWSWGRRHRLTSVAPKRCSRSSPEWRGSCFMSRSTVLRRDCHYLSRLLRFCRVRWICVVNGPSGRNGESI